MTDIKKAMLDPTAVFNKPTDVLRAADLSHEQKIEILERWRYDAQLLETAESENMAGGTQDLLEQILDALHTLGVKP